VQLEGCDPLGASEEISPAQWQVLLSYDMKRNQAKKSVNITQKRLDTSRSHDELSVTAKGVLIPPRLGQDLSLAQNTLDALVHVFEDMEQLNAQVEKKAARHAAVFAQGRIDNLATYLDRSSVPVNWITGQLLEISQAATSECRQEDPSVQSSWSSITRTCKKDSRSEKHEAMMIVGLRRCT